VLHLDIDSEDIDALLLELNLAPKKVNAAFNRGLKRTAASLRRQAGKTLKTQLELRNSKALKRRLKMIKLANRGNRKETGIWFGANDLPVSAFKGRPKKTATGATFKGHEFKHAFIGKRQDGVRTLFYRKGKNRYPIKECTLPVADKIQVFVEDNIFTEIEPIFKNHFERDLTARALFGVGKA
jgi:hypothetical protein